MATSILFDIILLIPAYYTFVSMFSFLLYDEIARGYIIMKDNVYPNQPFTEKLLFGIDYVFLTGVIIYFIVAFFTSFTEHASFLKWSLAISN